MSDVERNPPAPENHQEHAPNREPREKAIKDVIVVVGSVMMVMCFSMLLNSSIQNKSETNQTMIMTLSICGLFTFTCIFLFFLLLRSTRIRKRFYPNETLSNESQNVSIHSAHFALAD